MPKFLVMSRMLQYILALTLFLLVFLSEIKCDTQSHKIRCVQCSKKTCPAQPEPTECKEEGMICQTTFNKTGHIMQKSCTEKEPRDEGCRVVSFHHTQCFCETDGCNRYITLPSTPPPRTTNLPTVQTPAPAPLHIEHTHQGLHTMDAHTNTRAGQVKAKTAHKPKAINKYLAPSEKTHEDAASIEHPSNPHEDDEDEPQEFQIHAEAGLASATKPLFSATLGSVVISFAWTRAQVLLK